MSFTCSILDFGARMSDLLQTKAIQNAIDACFLAGGGTVTVPCGYFRTGGLRLRSGVTLYLKSGAFLEASSDPNDYLDFLNDELEPVNDHGFPKEKRSVYPLSRWNNAIIRAIDAKNIAIIGEPGSYISGSNCCDPEGEEDYRGPHGIDLQFCENIRLSGYSLMKTGNWAHAIFCSQNITADHLLVLGGHDGFDVRTCDNVQIEDCRFYTGDDCIAGFDNHDVLIRRCEFESGCSWLRFGGNHVLVEDCTGKAPGGFAFRKALSPRQKAAGAMTGPADRHSCHTPLQYYCDFRAEIRKTPGDMVIRHCSFESPDAGLLLPFDGKHQWCCNRGPDSITYEDCTITNVCEPMLLWGDANEKHLRFTLRDVTISAREGFEDQDFLRAANFESVTLERVRLEGYRQPTLVRYTPGNVNAADSTPIIIRDDSRP